MENETSPTELPPNPHRTDNRELAAFLLARGVKLLGHESDTRFVTFIFEHTPTLEDHIRAFFKGESISISTFLASQDAIRDIIGKERRKDERLIT